MASTFKDFEILSSNNYQIAATPTLVFAATSSAEVVSVEFHNTSLSTLWCRLYYPIQGAIGSDSASYQRVSETLSPGTTLEYKRTPLMLRSGSAIYASAQNSASINLSVIGRTV